MKTISDTPKTPPGYQTARSVLVLGRGAFFGDPSADLPANRSPLLQQDDLVPQFGYIGRLYASTRVLLLGIQAASVRVVGPTDKLLEQPLVFRGQPRVLGLQSGDTIHGHLQLRRARPGRRAFALGEGRFPQGERLADAFMPVQSLAGVAGVLAFLDGLDEKLPAELSGAVLHFEQPTS